MKFLTLADWTGMIETELFAQTYKSYGLATVRFQYWKWKPKSSRLRTDEVFHCGQGSHA